MKVTFTKILGVNLLISFGFGVMFLLADRHVSSFMFAGGITAMVLAGINLVIGIVALIIGKSESGKNFLACSGLLMLIGVSTCFGGLATMNTGHL
ncbi:MAG: hypothetical protein EOP52_05300 [Sphingobacteriales bacterium]|nr:MAG: hypothetical protein EOP52_05300 [Sphingobacteriales bacterium]